LPRKIRSAAGVDVRRILEIRRERKQRPKVPLKRAPAPMPDSTAAAAKYAGKCIAIGISTGGPPALSYLFEHLSPPLPPIVVVQHMPAKFTESLAWRLDSIGKLSVKEAATGDVLRPNHALIAPGEKHLTLQRINGETKAVIRDGEPVSGHKPSVDVMMTSTAKIFGPCCLGVIMTGMGRDGANGCKAIRDAGGYVLGQDESSSDVYGMNKVAMVEGNVDRQFALCDGPTTITQHVARLRQMRSTSLVNG
jgi:two-component system chemotaxis response regulator CheB